MSWVCVMYLLTRKVDISEPPIFKSKEDARSLVISLTSTSRMNFSANEGGNVSGNLNVCDLWECQSSTPRGMLCFLSIRTLTSRYFSSSETMAVLSSMHLVSWKNPYEKDMTLIVQHPLSQEAQQNEKH